VTFTLTGNHLCAAPLMNVLTPRSLSVTEYDVLTPGSLSVTEYDVLTPGV